MEPSYLFSASPAPEAGQPSLGDASMPPRCQVVIHALRAGTPVSWEVTASLESLLQPREGPGREDPPRRAAKAWDKPLHRLAARSVVRDNESVAQREAKLEQGGCCCGSRGGPGVPPALTALLRAGFARRFRLKAVQTSKACNVPSLYTRPVPVDGATQTALPAAPEVWGIGTDKGLVGQRGQQGDRGLRWHRPLQLAQPAGHELLRQGTGTTGAPQRVRGSSRRQRSRMRPLALQVLTQTFMSTYPPRGSALGSLETLSWWL